MHKSIAPATEKNGAKKDNAGKRQSTFYLTDEALESLKSCMEIINAPSINHALEFLLLELGHEVGKLKPAIAGDQQKIIAQAGLITEQYAEFIVKPKGKRKKEEIALFSSLNALQKLMHHDTSASQDNVADNDAR